jgi:hypothetical protein
MEKGSHFTATKFNIVVMSLEKQNTTVRTRYFSVINQARTLWQNWEIFGGK